MTSDCATSMAEILGNDVRPAAGGDHDAIAVPWAKLVEPLARADGR